MVLSSGQDGLSSRHLALGLGLLEGPEHAPRLPKYFENFGFKIMVVTFIWPTLEVKSAPLFPFAPHHSRALFP